MNVQVTCKNILFLEAFSSKTRIKIIELLNERPMNIKELATSLEISSAIVTKHVQKLEEAGIVSCVSSAGIRGMQKICSVRLEQAILQFKTKEQQADEHNISVPVGQYNAFQVKPTCGLASKTKIIGEVDDPRYFADPEHVQASIIWFASGWVTYRIPNYLIGNQVIRSLEISLEICSESPHYNENWPSDISFYFNDHFIGMWTCPGDFGATKGVYTPNWWRYGSKHGQLKTIIINEYGTFLDGIELSQVRIGSLGITQGKELFFKIASLETAANCGGVNLFGKDFGNYNQDIRITMSF
ncbi:MAG: transcriptional regulator, ArsR family [Paenibacillaceae bacterium]|jgi:predicted transcriptional regulator|nr:transcriptional regulator, ArsR family [Paenibacillaceae bacterium]